MADLEGIRTGRHCVFALHAHLVFVTKFRHHVFGDRHLARMQEIMRAACADFETALAPNVAYDAAGNLAYLATSGVNLRLTQERWPQLTFHATREHAVKLA